MIAVVPTVRAADAPPSDAEIAHIAYTADVIDIRYAHIALGISHDPALREFAETMIRDHSAAPPSTRPMPRTNWPTTSS